MTGSWSLEAFAKYAIFTEMSLSTDISIGMQGQYNTPEKHKEAMLGFLKGWNAPHVKKLIAETPADKILLSNIYERYVQVVLADHITARTCKPTSIYSVVVLTG